jgi:hypothetical protein
VKANNFAGGQSRAPVVVDSSNRPSAARAAGKRADFINEIRMVTGIDYSRGRIPAIVGTATYDHHVIPDRLRPAQRRGPKYRHLVRKLA